MLQPRCLTTLLLALTLVACGDKRAERRKLESPRDSAVVAVIVRGDSAFAHNDSTEARALWSLVVGFDSTDAEARQKRDAIPPRGISATKAEAIYADDVARLTNHERWCKFHPATAKSDLTNLRMLADRRLIPTVRTAGLRAPAGGCDDIDSFLLLGRPSVTAAEVRQQYGTPDQEVISADGSMVIDYGRFRLFGAADGKIIAILLPPFGI